jgi:hypothetical protein
MSPADIIARYHDLLDEGLAADTQAQLDEQQARRGLLFGDRPLCTVLRPRFLSPEQYAYLRQRIAVLLPAFTKLHEAALEDARFRAQFGLFDWEEELFLEDAGFAEPSPVSRLDAFFLDGPGGLRFTEYNAETPAAAAYSDVLAEMFLGLPAMAEFQRDFEVRPLPVRHNLMHALLDCYRQWCGGARGRPRVAIVDWREVPTYSEFVLVAEYLRAHGLDCVITDPREVEYAGGRLIAEGGPVDLVYKRVLIGELIGRGGLDQPLVRAVRDRAVCMVNPFRCKVLHKKASLAALSDERNARLFTIAERAAIDEHIPWTRVVEERRTVFDGEAIDLVPWILEHRDHLVLKPNDEYGGKGIVLGWQVSPQRWERAVAAALADPYIVQDRITLPTEPYPAWVDGALHIGERIVDTAPFVFHGAFADGCLTRLSTDPLVNVTAGGGSSLATFVVAPR